MAKIHFNICEHCGERFPTIYPTQKYCTKRCRMEARKNRSKEDDQPCWDCQNACGGCSWSQGFQPVQGWVAESYYIVADDQYSYDIKYCPEFIRG